MKMNRSYGALLAFVAVLGTGAAVIAFAAEGTDTTSATATTTPRRLNHPELGPMPRSPLARTTLHGMAHLNLTAAQHAQIRTILENAHAQEKASKEEDAMNMAVLGNPSDPGYSQAVAALKTHAENKIQQDSDLQSQLVNVLTPEQKQQLPAALARMQTYHEQQRHAGVEHHDMMR